MTVTLTPEQERILLLAIRSGVAGTPSEALDRALDTLRRSLHVPLRSESVDAVRRLASFGRRHHLSLNGMTIQELLRESRP